MFHKHPCFASGRDELEIGNLMNAGSFAPALVLNADFRPLNYFPLSLWSWQDSVKAVCLDRVITISEYEQRINSPSIGLMPIGVLTLPERELVNRVSVTRPVAPGNGENVPMAHHHPTDYMPEGRPKTNRRRGKIIQNETYPPWIPTEVLRYT